MKNTQKYTVKSPIADLKNSFQNFLSTYTNKYSEVFEALSRQAVPFGGNLLEKEHKLSGNASGNNGKIHEKPEGQKQEISENRFSVLYKRNAQYHHIGCSSQAEAQHVLSMMMTDENRIPVGIYDAKTDTFEWEIIGQYFHSQDPIEAQESRLEEVLTTARILRRRDSSWLPGYLQKPSFFA